MTKKPQLYKIKDIQHLKKISNDENADCPKFLRARLRDLLEIINELQQKNNLLELDLTAAQEIMGCMNKEKEELIKALNYIRSCDSATISAAKAIETLKKYENE